MEETIHSPRVSTSAVKFPKLNHSEVHYSTSGIRRGELVGWSLMAWDLARSKRLIWLLILRDLSIRYRQSVLGYVWAVVPQIVTVSVFAFLHASQVLPIGQTRIPYVAYALWGMSVWQLFAGCLVNCTASLVSSGSLVTKVNFPKEALVIASLGQAILDFLVRLVPIVIVFIWYGVAPSWQIVFMPLLLLPIILLALGLGFILAIVNLVIRDIGNGLGMVLTIGMFLTPVLYPPPVRWPFLLVNFVNPISPLLTASQEFIAPGFLIRPEFYAGSCIFAVGWAFAGWRAFRITISRVVGYA